MLSSEAIITCTLGAQPRAANARQAVDEAACLSSARVSAWWTQPGTTEGRPTTLRYKLPCGACASLACRPLLRPQPGGSGFRELGSYRETANRRFGCEGTTRICRTYLRVPHVPGVSTPDLSGLRLIMAFQPPEGLVAPPTALGPYASRQPRLRSDIRHHGIGGDYVISGFHVTGSFT